EPTLLDLVEYVGEWAEVPMLVLCLARPGLLEARPGWGGPTSTGVLLELEPLGATEVEALLDELSGEPLPAEVRGRIVEHAGGNPLYAEQLLAFPAEAPGVGLDRHDAADELVGYHLEQAYRYRAELARPDERARRLAASAGERLGRAGIRAARRADVPAATNLLARGVELLAQEDPRRREQLC